MRSRTLRVSLLALLAVPFASPGVQLEDDPLAYYQARIFPRMKPCRTTGTNPANYPGKMLPAHVEEIMRDSTTYGWEEFGKAGLRYWRRIKEPEDQPDPSRAPWTGAFWFRGPPAIMTTRKYLQVTPTSFRGRKDQNLDGKPDYRFATVNWTPPPAGFRDGQPFSLDGQAKIEEGGPAANVAWRGSLLGNADIDGRLGIDAGWQARHRGGKRTLVKKGNAWSCRASITPRPASADEQSVELKFSCGGGAFYRVTWTYTRVRIP